MELISEPFKPIRGNPFIDRCIDQFLLSIPTCEPIPILIWNKSSVKLYRIKLNQTWTRPDLDLSWTWAWQQFKWAPSLFLTRYKIFDHWFAEHWLKCWSKIPSMSSQNCSCNMFETRIQLCRSLLSLKIIWLKIQEGAQSLNWRESN